MPGWTGCDVCEVIDALRLILGDESLPLGSSFNDPQWSALEERLKVVKGEQLAHRALIVAEGLRESGLVDVALRISDAIPRITRDRAHDENGVAVMAHQSLATRQETWNQILERIAVARDPILDQANRAGEQFPELVSSFNLLLAYVGHLHKVIEQSPSLGLQPYRLPERFCERSPLICRCAHGSWSDCKLLGAEMVPIRPEEFSCDELWEQYLAALANERSELLQALQAVHTSGRPLVIADSNRLQTLTAAQQETRRLREALWNRKCAVPGAME